MTASAEWLLYNVLKIILKSVMTKIIAHRGASGYVPENTLAAFQAALDLGAGGIELDVQLTGDGQLIVCHDFSIDRTTNGSGIIADMTWKEIRQYDAGSWLNNRFRGERIQLLEEVLAALPDSVYLNIEVKKADKTENGIEEKLSDILIRHNRLKNSLIGSFNYDSLKKIRNINPDIQLAPIMGTKLFKPDECFKFFGFKVDAVSVNYVPLTQEAVKSWHSDGIKVLTWTVNNTKTARLFLDWGVDAVITNYPDLLEKAR